MMVPLASKALEQVESQASPAGTSLGIGFFHISMASGQDGGKLTAVQSIH